MEEPDRITPAYAGKTRAEVLRKFHYEDHPRIRGKDWDDDRKLSYHTGSPPHTRERPELVERLSMSVRITPAYAGKTILRCACDLCAEDHPRIRGKDLTKSLMAKYGIGSPPHTRERRVPTDEQTQKAGITPAYAGKTAISLIRKLSQQDHPRIRGKDKMNLNLYDQEKGSPPHTRERP